MSRTDIKKLQQQGRLEEALELAMNQYTLNPNALWARTDLAWVYDAMCKKSAAEGKVETFENAFRPIANLGLLTTDQMLSETLCWRFRSLMATCSAKMEALDKPAFAQRVWDMVGLLGASHPSEAYSVLCKAFYHLRDNWMGFIDFMDWWGWQNFRPEDYQQEKLPNGKTMPMSLVEGCHIAYAKLLLQMGDKDRMSAFLPRLESLGNSYPNMLYPGYYTGKLLVAIGGDKKAMLQSVLPFVRQKSGEFWAWQLLAEMEQDDESFYIACLLRAVNCKTKDAFLVKILYLLTNLSLAKQDFVAARTFLSRYVSSKMDSQSRMPSEVYHWMNEAWYKDSKVRQTSSILQLDYMQITDELLFADMPEHPLCITHIISEARIAMVVYGYQKSGRIRLPKSMKQINVGTCLLARIKEPVPSSNNLTTYSLRQVRWNELPPTTFLRTIEGKITSNQSKTAFFVKFGKEFAFLPKYLYKNKELNVDEKITAQIVYDYQKNKACWSWRCISIKF